MGDNVSTLPDDADERAVSGEARFLDCPICGVTLDCFMDPNNTGFPRVVPIERVRCPRCGNENLDVATIGEEDDAYHSRVKEGQLIAAEYVPPMDADLARYMKEGAAGLADSGVFGMEFPEDKEPQWPKRMCEVIIGCALYVGSKIQMLVKKKHDGCKNFEAASGPASDCRGDGSEPRSGEPPAHDEFGAASDTELAHGAGEHTVPDICSRCVHWNGYCSIATSPDYVPKEGKCSGFWPKEELSE